MAQTSPSLLSANFLNLKSDIAMINASEADWLHYDVMDGSFVPNISFGFPVLSAVMKDLKKPLDAHFMVLHPESWIKECARLGVRMFTVHREACPQLHRTIQEIHEAGMLAGVALNPGTSISTIEDVLCDVDLVLIMTVNPGFGGQSFIHSSLDKIRRLRKMIAERGSRALIECDGGVNTETAQLLVDAGVDILVAGSHVFRSSDPIATIKALKSL